MDGVENAIETYRAIIRRVMREIRDYIPDEEGIRYELILDDASGHYELMRSGWFNHRRIHGSVLHIDLAVLSEPKVYVEHDGTNLEVVNELLAAGIPAKRIVLGFHPPQHRQYTEFAVS